LTPDNFRSDAIGVAIPYGIYDLLANRGSVFVGVSHDTAAFAAHSIASWWKRDGPDRYHRRRQLLILADTGGSNSCRISAWKPNFKANSATAWAHRNCCSLPHRRFQMETHRAPAVLRDLQELGRRAS